MLDMLRAPLIAAYTMPLGSQILLAALAFMLIRHRRKRPFSTRQKTWHICLLLAVLALGALQVAVSFMAVGYYGLATRVAFPVLGAIALSQILNIPGLIRHRGWRSASKNAILPTLLLMPIALSASPFGDIAITPPEATVQLDGEMTIEVTLSPFSPPGYLLINTISADRPSGRSYTRHSSMRTGPLMAKTVFILPGTTRKFTVAANKVWCAPTDYPMTCPSGPGNYRIKASLFTTGGASVGWPSTWPKGKLLTGISSEFQIRDGDADPFANAARGAILQVLRERLETATFDAATELEEHAFRVEDNSYCGRWTFKEPFLGAAEACIPSSDANGIQGYFDEEDVRVDHFDLRVPEGMMTPREAVIYAKRAMLAFGATRSTDAGSLKMPEYGSSEWQRSLTAMIASPSKESAVPSWQIDMGLTNMTRRKISVLVRPDGSTCINPALHNTVYAPDGPCELFETSPKNR